MQDLFSELSAPPPQQQAAQLPAYLQQPSYGQMGQVYGQRAGRQGGGYMGGPAGLYPYPYAQPVPPGYQPFMLANPAAAPPPQLASFQMPGAQPAICSLTVWCTFDMLRLWALFVSGLPALVVDQI